MIANYNISQLEKVENMYKQIDLYKLNKSKIKICLTQKEFNAYKKEVNKYTMNVCGIEIFNDATKPNNIKYKGVQIKILELV